MIPQTSKIDFRTITALTSEQHPMKATKPRTPRSVAYNFGEEQVQFLDPHAYFASESIDNMAHTSQLSAL
jgi:hypothetical protein